jgi:hypothetical protein
MILGSISKRGNRYLRALFVPAAWVVLAKFGPKGWERYGLKAWIEAGTKHRLSRCCRSTTVSEPDFVQSFRRFLLGSVNQFTSRRFRFLSHRPRVVQVFSHQSVS